jgi:hypothetical protein
MYQYAIYRDSMYQGSRVWSAMSARLPGSNFGDGAKENFGGFPDAEVIG